MSDRAWARSWAAWSLFFRSLHLALEVSWLSEFSLLMTFSLLSPLKWTFFLIIEDERSKSSLGRKRKRAWVMWTGVQLLQCLSYLSKIFTQFPFEIWVPVLVSWGQEVGGLKLVEINQPFNPQCWKNNPGMCQISRKVCFILLIIAFLLRLNGPQYKTSGKQCHLSPLLKTSAILPRTNTLFPEKYGSRSSFL